jgi:hypothetical protein
MHDGLGRDDIAQELGYDYTNKLFAQMRADGTLDAAYIAGRNEWSAKYARI